MRHILKNTKPAARRKAHGAESGQALVEFALVMLILILLAYSLMDFCVAVYEKQLLTNLSREGANLSARGVGTSQLDIMSNALFAVWMESSPLNLSNSHSGRLILTSAAYTTDSRGHGNYVVTHQLQSGSLTASSLVAPNGTNGLINVPTNLVAAGHSLYIAEVFYSNSVPAPIKKLIPINITNRFYDVAFFPGG
ncbi:MAG TPA: TadE/TadG family type IV pilus assembly protein [Verrucomicrobiae bacterium]|nr:TadE/TadG family type IV pilus assembly protein [Verrucomicrobiae bacterium]